MDVFLDLRADQKTIISAEICIFQLIYNITGVLLVEARYNTFSRKATADVIKPESLPPTQGAAAEHSLRAYLHLHDWMLLRSMSLNPKDYGWKLRINGYEPILTLDPMAPKELLQFISYNCHGDCNTRRCSCVKNEVKCISACGNCKGLTCKNICLDDSCLDEI